MDRAPNLLVHLYDERVLHLGRVPLAPRALLDVLRPLLLHNEVALLLRAFDPTEPEHTALDAAHEDMGHGPVVVPSDREAFLLVLLAEGAHVQITPPPPLPRRVPAHRFLSKLDHRREHQLVRVRVIVELVDGIKDQLVHEAEVTGRHTVDARKVLAHAAKSASVARAAARQRAARPFVVLRFERRPAHLVLERGWVLQQLNKALGYLAQRAAPVLARVERLGHRLAQHMGAVVSTFMQAMAGYSTWAPW